MAGIKIQKNYLSTSTNVNVVSNNWMTLVFGITSRGPTRPTLVQSYTTFLETFGQPVEGSPTHNYMRFVLENGVPVLFKRVIDSSKITKASYTKKLKTGPNSKEYQLYSVTANDNYSGTTGNHISYNLEYDKSSTNKTVTFNVFYDSSRVESYSLGEAETYMEAYFTLLYNFLYRASTASTQQVSSYVDIKLLNEEDWTTIKAIDDTTLEQIAENQILSYDTTSGGHNDSLTGGTEPDNTLESAISLLQDENSEVYNDVRLLHAMTYYPQLRFCTTGGIIAPATVKSSDSNGTTYSYENHEKILKNLGTFATNCKSTFRVLVDYSVEMTDIEVVRTFAKSTATEGKIDPSIYAFFGWYGSDNYNNFLPGSAGFLTALVSAGYNVYNRRIAGTSFTPAFGKAYKDEYIDALQNWQAEDKVQANPMIIIDAADNLAVMGASTLAMPLGVLSARNPRQALDIICVSDYIAATLHNIALGELEAAYDRLLLSALSNRMSLAIEKFVTSNAITRYDLNFDTTQLGKLGIECILYFAIGLEEVSITVTSTYDTEIFA